MPYQKQTFIDYPNEGYTILKAEHLKHMEEGISNALIPEAKQQLSEASDVFKESTTYWNSGYCQVHDAANQTFGEDYLVPVAGVFNPTMQWYITSPLIRLESQFNHRLMLSSGQYIRQLFIFNADGKLLCQFGNNDPTKTFSGGFTSIRSTINSSETLVANYPTLATVKSDTDITFNSALIQELNSLYIAESDDPESIATHEENAVVYLSFNLHTTTARPTAEDEAATWFISQVLKCRLIKTKLYDAYELTSLVLPKTSTRDYFKSSRFNSVVEELGEFKSDVGMDNVNATVKTTTITWSEILTEDFYPEAYHDRYVDSNFAITDFENLTYSGVNTYSGYKITRPMPLDFSKLNVSYKCTGFLRHFALISEYGSQLYWGQNVRNLEITPEYLKSIGVDPLEVRYLCVSNHGDNLAAFKFTATTTHRVVTYELPNLRLTADQSSGSSSGTGASNVNVINLSNVDRIVAIGDSYTESHYTIKDKAWLSKVSLLSDYNYDNFAISGDTYRGQLNKIRTGTYHYASLSGMTWEKLHPTHTLLISKTNDTKYMDCQQFIYDMVATLETTKGLGAIPIVATEYHVSDHDFVQTAFNYYAQQYGGYYIDLTEKDYTLRGAKDYAPFWGGSHPGTRTNHILADPVINYINKNLPRPYSSIKIFRARDASKVNNLDNYIFGTIEERAKKFKEISICHSALRDPSLYDNCTDKSNGRVESEYFKLMENIPVKFDKVCLIDVILPTTVHDITEVELVTNDMEGVNCYVKDVLAEPYPSPAFCRRFDIPQVLTEDQVKVGNTYTSNKSLYSGNPVTYTVVEILRDQQVESGSGSGFVNGTILICSGNRTTSAYNNSVLTLTSGEGDATLNCSYEAVGLSSDYPAGKQAIGHYTLLPTYGLVTDSLLKRAVDCDKITFLLVSDSEINLQRVEIKFKGNITKTRISPAQTNLPTPEVQGSTSLLPHTTFDDANIAYWLKNNSVACGLTPVVPADEVMPKNISKIVTLNPGDAPIFQKFTSTTSNGKTCNTRYKAKIWARYFPDIFNSATMTYPDEASITEDSFDWATLNILLYDSTSRAQANTTVKLPKLVGLHWTEVEADFILPPINKDWYIGLSVEDKPIQLAYCEII